jgi:hypothetical protein
MVLVCPYGSHRWEKLHRQYFSAWQRLGPGAAGPLLDLMGVSSGGSGQVSLHPYFATVKDDGSGRSVDEKGY